MNKKTTCKCYENLIMIGKDRYICGRCGTLKTKIKYIKRKRKEEPAK